MFDHLTCLRHTTIQSSLQYLFKILQKHFKVNKPSNFRHLCVYYGCHPLYILLKFMKIKRQVYVWTSVYLKIVNAKGFQ